MENTVFKKGGVAYIDGRFKVIIERDDGYCFSYRPKEGCHPEQENDVFSSNRDVYKLTSRRIYEAY